MNGLLALLHSAAVIERTLCIRSAHTNIFLGYFIKCVWFTYGSVSSRCHSFDIFTLLRRHYINNDDFLIFYHFSVYERRIYLL